MVHPYSHFGVYLFLHVPLLSLPMLTKSGQELYQIFLLFYFGNNVFGSSTPSGEGCRSYAMASRRLCCSWRVSGASNGRMTKVLVIRDYRTQCSLLVLGITSNGTDNREQLDTGVLFKPASLSDELDVLLPIIAGRTPLSCAPRLRQGRGTSSRSLLPRIRSNFRKRARHHERAHYSGRWQPLLRSYAELADLQRVQHILRGYFHWCMHNFITLMEAQPS